MQIRRMKEEDFAQVAEIEKECFSLPWSEKSFRDACNRQENVYLVAAKDKEVLGYIGMWAVLGEGEITNVAVKPSARRQGVADRMLEELFAIARAAGTDIFFLEVRESNAAARKLYEKQGFSQIGIRKNFYERPQENAVVMSRTFF